MNEQREQREYKGDAVVQVWIDSRVLVEMARWLDGQGVRTHRMSELVRLPLEALSREVVQRGQAQKCETTLEARKELEERYGVNLNRGNRGKKNLLKNLQLDVSAKSEEDELERIAKEVIERERKSTEVPKEFDRSSLGDVGQLKVHKEEE